MTAGLICLMQIRSHAARICLASLWAFVCAMAVAAPLLAAHSFVLPAAIYLFFSRICHQIPARCFWIAGYPLAVCHRCFGIYFGLFAGSLITIRSLHHSRERRAWLIAAIVPLCIDALLPYSGFWENSPASRFVTGFFFGVVSAQILLQGAGEFLREFSLKRLLSVLCIRREALHE
jgi:uncharacterized membrane protein